MSSSAETFWSSPTQLKGVKFGRRERAVVEGRESEGWMAVEMGEPKLDSVNVRSTPLLHTQYICMHTHTVYTHAHTQYICTRGTSYSRS